MYGQLIQYSRTDTALSTQEVNAELFSRWLQFVDRTPKTVQTYTGAIRQFAEYLQQNGITQPTRADVIAYKQSLAGSHKPSTITVYMAAIRRFFIWAEIEGIYPNVAKEVHGEKMDRGHKRDYLTKEQCKDMLSEVSTDTLQGKRDYAMLALMMTCGLRTIEVQRANIEDFRTMGNQMRLYVQGKGRTERTEYVIIPAPTEKAIRAYLAERGEQDDKAPLFVSCSHNSSGQRMTTRSISGVAKTAMRAAGFNDSRHTAHSLRHTAVTLALIANGGNIQEAQQFARHADISTTTIYAHNLEMQNNTCSAGVADAIFSA